MKISSVSKKFPLWIVISSLIVVVGLIIFFVFGVNVPNELKDKTSITVTYDAYITVDDERRDELERVATDAITNSGLTIVDTVFSTETSGGTVEFFFDKSTDTSSLESALSAALSALSSSTTIGEAVYEGSVHTYVSQHFYTYVWRGAIAVVAGIAAAFIYVSIRFKLNMGITTAVTTAHNVLLVTALCILCRIPLGSAYMAAVGIALIYSLINALIAMICMRSAYRDENIKALPSEEQLQAAYESYRGPVSKLNLAFIAVMGLMTAVCTIGGISAIATFAAVGLLCGLVGLYSSFLFMPALYAPLKVRADKRAAYKASPEYKAKKRAAKGSDKDID